MSSKLSVALTGGIGSGKSTISSKFESLGVPVIDSDIIARQIVEPGHPCLKAVIDEFGIDILDGAKLDRKKLGALIFSNIQAKQRLENILHPTIYENIEKQISDIDYPYCIVEIPLLIETRAMDRFDRILVIDIPEDIQLSRIVERDNIPTEYIMNIIKNQISRGERLKFADDIIENNGKIDDLDQSIQKLHNKYLKLASENE